MPGEWSCVSSYVENTRRTGNIHWPTSKPVKGKLPKPPDVIQACKEEKWDWTLANTCGSWRIKTKNTQSHGRSSQKQSHTRTLWNVVTFVTLGTLSNRRRRPDNGNWKRDISFKTSLQMHNTLWPDVALKLRTWEHGVSHHDENLSTSWFCFDTFSVLLCYFRAKPR